MKTYLLQFGSVIGKSLFILIGLILLSRNNNQAQSVTVLPGETLPLNYSKVFTGNGYDAGTVCLLNKGKGMLTIGIEVQMDNTATWPENRIAIKYNGQWYQIFEIWTGDPQTHTSVSTWDVNRFSSGSPAAYTQYLSDPTRTKIAENYSGSVNKSIYLKNLGVLKRYDGQYLPQTGDITNRVYVTDYNNFTIQTAAASSAYNYPVRDPQLSSGVQAEPKGYLYNHCCHAVGNLPGVGAFQESPGRGVFYINIVNLPPDMLESGNFRVHLYQNANTAHDRIYEWVYNNENFMNNAPISLTATTDLCGKVTLNWGNATNTLPTDGDLTLKTVVFRNGTYLAMVNGNVTTYDDATATQDVEYQYSLRHVAFSESGKTYWRSPQTSSVKGHVKKSPDQPISPTASINKCTGEINVGWAYNGTNPQFFRIDTSKVATGPFGIFEDSLAGSSRSYNHSGVPRGVTHYYRLYAVSSCNVISTSYAECNGISMADPALPTNVTATINATYDTITVSWTDAANNESKYQIQRQDDQGNLVTYDVNPKTGSGTTMTYKDFGISACRSYTYSIKVFNECVQSGLISATAQVNNIPPPSLNTTFTATKKLTCSKGYFTNRVELNWQNNNGQNIDIFKIYRKINGSSFDSTLVGTSPAGSGFYVDQTADARVYYKYTIIGIKYCNGTDILSNASEDIGFRNPTGIVSGHIEYNGGIALKGAKVLIEPSTGAAGTSLQFSSGSTLTMENSDTLNLTNKMRFEFWYKPTSATNGNIVTKTGVFSFTHSGTDYIAAVTTSGISGSITIPDSNFPLNNWKHVSMQYDGVSGIFKLYANGIMIGSSAASGNIASVSNQIVFGGVNSSFLLDEVRLIANTTLDTNIYTDHSRFLNSNIQGARINLHLDEGFGDYAYDVSSQSNIFNARHFVKTSGVAWSIDIPASSQLGYKGITDSLGNYTVTGITFSGTGENYNIIPSFLTHTFTPSSRSVYIGDASTIFNNQDFIDNSSFPVSGTLFYKGSSCPADGAYLKIDGSIVIQNGSPVTTDLNGNFSIQVPIGQHYVSLEKNGHTYSDTAGRFPVTGTYNFQAPVSGIQFIDSTYVKVIGRVVGGTRESEKPMIPGRSKNNIGQAKIRFETFNGCYVDSVTTNVTSGDYVINLLPLKYKIVDFDVTNPASVTANYSTFLDPVFDVSQLDLITIPPVQKIIDTLFTSPSKTTWSSIDSVEYQKIKSWTYRNAPSIWVKDTLGRPYLTYSGDTILMYNNTITQSTDTVVAPYGTFPFPIFKEFHLYSFDVGVKEVYRDLVLNYTDSVPVTKGQLTINNGLAADATVKQFDLSDSVVTTTWNKDTSYYRNTFKCGKPSLAYTGGDPNNFMSQMTISYQQGTVSANWLPNAGNTPYKALVLGSKSSDGQSFVSVGPEIPTFILRDPPGSQSVASLETGKSTTATYSWNVNEELGGTFHKSIAVGTEFTVGLGVQTPTDIENSLTLKSTVEVSMSQSGSLVETITVNESWETSGSSDFVGSEGDIYVGKAMNITFGLSGSILLLKDTECSLPGIECRSETITINGQNYKIGKKVSLAAAPGGYATSFIYTQDHIVNTLIPRLKKLRNQLFVNKPVTYQSKITDVNNPGYGRNNDDPYFGALVSTSDPLKTEAADTTGESYTYKAPATPIIVQVKSTLGVVTTDTLPPAMGDSIRWYNQQIRLWEEAVAMNEADKYAAMQNPASLKNNYSFSSGVTYTNSTTTENENEFSFEFEVGITEELVNKLGAKVGGVGVELESGLSLKLSGGYGKSETETKSTTWSFTFLDEDVGDFYSVDVRNSSKGWGPIFSVVAGETSCPWEGNDSSLYFTSGGQKVLLSAGTFHREWAELKVDGSPAFSQKLNIPSGSSATYNLELINLSESDDDIDYGIKVLSATNPNGAIVSIDGYSPSTLSFPVPAGSSLLKTLVLKQGPVAYDYDSIGIVIHSLCNDPAVGDTVYVTARFLPTCSDVAIASPLDKWVVNNSFSDSLNIVINNYDINFNGLKSIGLEFKPTSQSAWISEKDWFKNVINPSPDSTAISQSSSNTLYRWGLTGLPDGDYDLRVKSACNLADKYSGVYTGIVDRINPHPFGTPSPGDGILDPNDDISIQFNEQVNVGALSSQNFDVRGVLNGGNIRHAESLNFDGVNDYVEVQGGAALQKRNFTIEFWAQRDTTALTSAQTVFSQGTEPANSLAAGFDASGKFKFSLGNASVTSGSVVTNPGEWHHYAIAYDFASQVALLYIDGSLVNSGNTSILQNYIGSGKLFFGKNNASNSEFFAGNLHEIRLWNKTKTVGEITIDMNVTLTRNKSGLLYNWRMDEAKGSVVADYIRARDGVISGATWQVNPSGSASQFDGSDDYITVNSSTIAITQEMDFTLEFWFNSQQAGIATLFSNGKGDGLTSDSLYSWNIQKDANGKIHVYHKGYDFVAVDSNFFDGKWHHFALVMQRSGNLSAYIDGNLQKSVQANSFKQMGGAKFYIGAHGYMTGTIETVQSHYNGKMDEFRFWNTARKLEQIRRDQNNRLLGNELGLTAYIPFESYVLQLGVPVLAASFNDFSSNNLSTSAQNGTTLISQTPTIKLPRPVQSVNFTYSVNNDKIVITPTSSPDLIENVTLDITVRNVLDMRGNKMQSPKTWIAYINKNQVKWQDVEYSFQKPLDSLLTFKGTIVNTGGAAKSFTISNLPNWLTASTTSGIISPNSTQQITFTVNASVNIGDYTQDIFLTTDFNYPEKLTLNLKVRKPAPNWQVNASAYQYSMSIVGQLKMDGIISANTEDKLAAFINGEVRGVAQLVYVAAYDKYEVYMNIYSNSITGDSIKFQIWNATTGEVYVDVTPSLLFAENSVYGTPANPQIFEGTNIIVKDLSLNTGWTWVSFPLKSAQYTSSNNLLQDISATNGDVIKGISTFDQYDSGLGWIGTISGGAGYSPSSSYKVKISALDTIVLKGSVLHPDSADIIVQPGWNWIGFVSPKNLPLNNALANYNAQSGDVVKSQYEFSYYDNQLGWVGSLQYMKPGLGYMLSATVGDTFNYPVSSLFGKLSMEEKEVKPLIYSFTPGVYEKNMSVIAKGNICNQALSDGNYYLGAFDNSGYLRGYAIPAYMDATDEYLFFITLHGNIEGENIYFRYFNNITGEEIIADEKISFASNQLSGLPANPYIINVADSASCPAQTLSDNSLSQNGAEKFITVSPNPFTDNLMIKLKGLPEDAVISLINPLGEVIYSAVAGRKQWVKIDTISLAKGVYFIRILGTDLNEQTKVVKIN